MKSIVIGEIPVLTKFVINVHGRWIIEVGIQDHDLE